MEIIRRNGHHGSLQGPDTRPGVYTNGGDQDPRDVFHVSFDPTTEPVERVVVEAVAVIRNAEPDQLTPLNKVIDPEALDGLLASAAEKQVEQIDIQFVYEGLTVTVTSDGDLWLQWETPT